MGGLALLSGLVLVMLGSPISMPITFPSIFASIHPMTLTELMVHVQMKPGVGDTGSSLALNEPLPDRDPPHDAVQK